MRRVVIPSLLLSALLTLTLAAAPVAAQTQTATAVLDRAAAALPRDPVYVDPEAERRDAVDADRLRERIRGAGTPVFVAVLPASAAQEAGSVNELPAALNQKMGLSGTYAVVAGGSFRAGSTSVRGVGTLATAAAQANSGDLQAALEDFVRRVGSAAAASTSGGAGAGGQTGATAPFDDGQGAGSNDDGGGGGGSALPLLLLLGGGGAGVWYFSKKGKQRRAEQAKRDEHDRGLIQAELSVLAEDVMSLEPQISLHPAAADDYEAATSRFRVAQAALEHADDPIDLVRVQRVVDEGRYAMSRAKAIIQGREPPPPPAELTQPGRRGEPPVDLDEDGRPAYVGAGGYGSPFYGGGWFGGGGSGILTGLFLGSMLGGGWGWGSGGGDVTNIYNEGGGDGGDWGGGDFGGGDFGGGFGDVGGGDF